MDYAAAVKKPPTTVETSSRKIKPLKRKRAESAISDVKETCNKTTDFSNVTDDITQQSKKVSLCDYAAITYFSISLYFS